VKVNVRLFAVLRERAGADTLELDLDDGATVGDLVGVLRATRPELGLRADQMVVAINRDYVGESAVIAPGDEVALIPPVSGGAGPVRHVAVTPDRLDPAGLAELVADARAGAVVTFQGVPRDVPALDYEAYAEMAEAKLAELAAAVAEAHGLVGVAVAHRTGTVPAREASVVVAVSAAHRAEAFAGARELLDRVKAEAPIWKAEPGGEAEPARWVEGTVPPVSPA
jgi:molybdopterin synthase catalytic subunit